jgi:hypothetical protein
MLYFTKHVCSPSWIWATNLSPISRQKRTKRLGYYKLKQSSSLAQFFSQNFRRDSRQVCRPSAEIADKFVGLVLIFSVTGIEKYQLASCASAIFFVLRVRWACAPRELQKHNKQKASVFFSWEKICFILQNKICYFFNFGHTKNQTEPTSLSA